MWSSSFSPLQRALLAVSAAAAIGLTYHNRLLVGAPGSGKSTLCLELERTTCGPLVRISQDDLGSRKACERLAQRSLKQRRSVIIDRCNFDAQQRSTWLTIARQQ